MDLALKKSKYAYIKGEVPIGAVIVNKEGEIIESTANATIANKDPTAHAEMIAISAAASTQSDWRLDSATIYVTKEPCPMCAGAIINSRIKTLIFGAYDERKGCCGSLYQLCGDKRLDSKTSVRGGVEEEKCGKILKEFFKTKRI